MSKDKYPSIFSPQMEAIVFILQIFFATRVVLKIGEYSRIFPSFSWGIFSHVTRLDQSRASENMMDYNNILRMTTMADDFNISNDLHLVLIITICFHHLSRQPITTLRINLICFEDNLA